MAMIPMTGMIWKNRDTLGLEYYYRENGVHTCCQFGMVMQQLQYEFFYSNNGRTFSWIGGYHGH